MVLIHLLSIALLDSNSHDKIPKLLLISEVEDDIFRVSFCDSQNFEYFFTFML